MSSKNSSVSLPDQGDVRIEPCPTADPPGGERRPSGGTSHLWPVVSFTTVTESPESPETHRAAVIAWDLLRYELDPRVV